MPREAAPAPYGPKPGIPLRCFRSKSKIDLEMLCEAGRVKRIVCGRVLETSELSNSLFLLPLSNGLSSQCRLCVSPMSSNLDAYNAIMAYGRRCFGSTGDAERKCMVPSNGVRVRVSDVLFNQRERQYRQALYDVCYQLVRASTSSSPVTWPYTRSQVIMNLNIMTKTH